MGIEPDPTPELLRRYANSAADLYRLDPTAKHHSRFLAAAEVIADIVNDPRLVHHYDDDFRVDLLGWMAEAHAGLDRGSSENREIWRELQMLLSDVSDNYERFSEKGLARFRDLPYMMLDDLGREHAHQRGQIDYGKPSAAQDLQELRNRVAGDALRY